MPPGRGRVGTRSLICPQAVLRSREIGLFSVCPSGQSLPCGRVPRCSPCTAAPTSPDARRALTAAGAATQPGRILHLLPAPLCTVQARCCSRGPRAGRLDGADVRSLPVLEARAREPSTGGGTLPPEVLGLVLPCQPSCWGSRRSWACGSIASTSASVSTASLCLRSSLLLL